MTEGGPGTNPPSPWRWWRRRRARRERAARLYAAVVRAARAPFLYRELEVPDTVEARFEMVSLHLLVVARALRRHGGEEAALAQSLVDTFFTDLDRNLRDMGIGDLSMGRHMKRLLRTFLARARDLEAALAARDEKALSALLARNLGEPRPHDEALTALARRFLELDTRFQQADPAQLTDPDRWPMEGGR